MAAHGRPTLRDLFDEAPTPHIAHPPETHHREYYLATDGSYFETNVGGLGVVIETRDGQRVARIARSDQTPDNNIAEYRALHLGLDVLATQAPADARVGVLVDHDELAANVNTLIISRTTPGGTVPREYSIPPAAEHHWRGIQARIAGLGEVRTARIASDQNPAHPLANAPQQYAHLGTEHDRQRAQETPEGVPPPSRGAAPSGHASD